MKLIDYAVLQAAEAKPSIETWECNIDDWLAAGHPGEARVYTTRDGTVTLRPSRDCPRGEIRPQAPPKPRRNPTCENCAALRHAEAGIGKLTAFLDRAISQSGFKAGWYAEAMQLGGFPACRLRWLDPVGWHECVEPKGHVGAHCDGNVNDAEAKLATQTLTVGLPCRDQDFPLYEVSVDGVYWVRILRGVVYQTGEGGYRYSRTSVKL